MGHTFGEAVVTKEATETQTGIKTSTCTICGEIKEEVIPYAEPETPDEDEKTDAWQTVDYAMKQGKAVINLADEHKNKFKLFEKSEENH